MNQEEQRAQQAVAGALEDVLSRQEKAFRTAMYATRPDDRAIISRSLQDIPTLVEIIKKAMVSESVIDSVKRFEFGTDHYPECWRSPDHHYCAQARIDRLETELRLKEAGLP